jgi:hypothetical protein
MKLAGSECSDWSKSLRLLYLPDSLLHGWISSCCCSYPLSSSKILHVCYHPLLNWHHFHYALSWMTCKCQLLVPTAPPMHNELLTSKDVALTTWPTYSLSMLLCIPLLLLLSITSLVVLKMPPLNLPPFVLKSILLSLSTI